MNNEHWTEDEELLTRFALDRIDATERIILERHLLTCDTCRQIAHAERELAAGAKRAGRNELKKRLQAHISHQQARQVPWPRILSAAAVVFLIIGVGIYNRWFTTQGKITDVVEERQLSSRTEEYSLSDRDSGSPQGNAIQQPESKDMPLEPTPRMITPLPAPSLKQTRKTKAKGEAPETTKDMIVPTEQTSVVSQHAAGATSQREELAQSPKDIRAAQDGKIAQATAWIEGTVLSSDDPIGTTHFPARIYGADKEVQPNKTISLEKQTKKSGQLQMKGDVEPQEITFSQQQAFSGKARRNDQHRDQQTVRTLVEQTGAGIRMTLFLDSLVNEATLRAASVEHITDDSLIVHIANQRIGYRFPTGWNTQQISPPVYRR